MRHFKPPAGLFPSRTIVSGLRAMEPLFASAGLGVWHLDGHTGKLWWSQRTRQIHEVEPDFEPETEAAVRFYAVQAQATIMAAIHQAQQAGTSWDLTLPASTATGRPIMLRSCGLSIMEVGVNRHLLGICEDLTNARHQAEEHERLALVVEQMTSAAMIADRAGRTVWVNPAFEQLTGYSFSEMAGRSPGRVLQGPDTDPETVWAMGEAVRAGVPYRTEILNYRKDGSPLWVELNISPIRAGSGDVTGFVAIQSDVGARRAAQDLAQRELKTRRDAETLLRDMLDAVPTAISAYGPDNRLLVVNRMKQEVFPEHAASLKQGMPLQDVLRS